MARVFDVAKYILHKKGPMTTMKLEKLTYYCQAWSLAWDDVRYLTKSLKHGQMVQFVLNYLKNTEDCSW